MSKVLVTGGSRVGISMIVNSEIYDPADGTWSLTASLNEHYAPFEDMDEILVMKRITP